MFFEIVLVLSQQLIHLTLKTIEFFFPILFFLLQMSVRLLSCACDLIATIYQQNYTNFYQYLTLRFLFLS